MKPFANMKNIILGLVGITESTVRAIPFLWRELDIVDSVVNPAKTCGLHPQEDFLTAEQVWFVASVDAQSAEEVGAAV